MHKHVLVLLFIILLTVLIIQTEAKRKKTPRVTNHAHEAEKIKQTLKRYGHLIGRQFDEDEDEDDTDVILDHGHETPFEPPTAIDDDIDDFDDTDEHAFIYDVDDFGDDKDK
jgi:hypothetical protein